MLPGCEEDREPKRLTPWLRRLSEAWQKENCPLLGSQRKLRFSCRNKLFSSWVELTLTPTEEMSEAWKELWQFEHVIVLRADNSLMFAAVMFLITRWKTLKDITDYDEIVYNPDPSYYDTDWSADQCCDCLRKVTGKHTDTHLNKTRILQAFFWRLA